MSNIFYVYALVDPRNSLPFYIGKGCRNRAYKHVEYARLNKNDRSPYKQNVIKKMLSENVEPIVDFIKTNISESEAYDLETELIKKYGRRKDGGILTNICLDARPPKLVGSWEMRFGKEKADELKLKSSLRMIEQQRKIKGKTYEEIYGENKSKSLRAQKSEIMKQIAISNPSHLFQKNRTVSIIERDKMKKRMLEHNHMSGNTHSEEARAKISKNHAVISGRKNPNAKRYIIKDPDGKIFVVEANMVSFCKQHGIEYTSLLGAFKNNKGCVNGKSKGWQILEISLLNTRG